MQLSWGINLLFGVAALVSLLAPWILNQTGSDKSIANGQPYFLSTLPNHFKQHWPQHIGGLAMAGGLALLAFGLHLELANHWAYLCGGAALMSLLGSLPLTVESRGLILLTVAFSVFSRFTELMMLPLPVLASFLGLTLAKLWHLDTWEDLLLPGAWLVGVYWLTSSASYNLMLPNIALLTVILAVSLFVRALQSLPALKQALPILQAVFLVLTGGLSAWLSVQNLLLQPALLPWAGLFTGSIALGFVLFNPADDTRTDEHSGSLPKPLQASALALIGVGIAALVASRLFDTLGYVILAIGLLSQRRLGSFGAVAACFFLGRVLLQAFLQQHNTNITGINIMHPYASAALYIGFGVMLLAPHWLNACQVRDDLVVKKDTSNCIQYPSLAVILISHLALTMAGIANYFLHVEATASLLLALLVAGLGVGLLGDFKTPQARSLPLVFTLTSLTGVLASPEVLSWGTEADKSQKLILLGVAFVVLLIAGILAHRLASRRQPVQVS